MGCIQAVTFHQSRRPQDASLLMGTWLAMLLPLALVGVIGGYFLVPVALADQTHVVQQWAQLFLAYAVVGMLNDLFIGLALGDGAFRFYGFMRAAVPVSTLVAYGVLEMLHRLTVFSASCAIFGSSGVVTLVAGTRALRRYGVRRPSMSLARETLWYGFKGHGTNIALFLNARLDTLILPGFVAASQLGLYSMATNVSWILYALPGALYVLIIPAAARRERESQAAVVFASMYTAGAIALSLSLIIGILAPLAVRIVYGSAFVPGVLALRILLPGSVCYVAASMLWQGLYAAGRPFLSSACQFTGLVVTVAGLAVFLPRGGGIVSASIVSSVAYTVTFAVALVLYTRTIGLPLAAVLQVGRWRQEWAAQSTTDVAEGDQVGLGVAAAGREDPGIQ